MQANVKNSRHHSKRRDREREKKKYTSTTTHQKQAIRNSTTNRHQSLLVLFSPDIKNRMQTLRCFSVTSKNVAANITKMLTINEHLVDEKTPHIH